MSAVNAPETRTYDAILLVSFGGPENRQDVLPFLENVTRGKLVPRERLLEVAEHYYKFGGRSPINDQNRKLIALLEDVLREKGPHLPVYWGNRNWHPMLAETVARMRDDGIRRALAFVTSAFGSYSGCRQYLEDIERARAEAGPGAPVVDKIRTFFNHPGFIQVIVDQVERALDEFPALFRDSVELVFTAHSIPTALARTSPYVEQLQEAARLVAEGLGRNDPKLVYQSRSGPPSQPWLEPDICDHLRQLAASDGSRNVVVIPLGFISDHMEVIYDLDTEARQLANELGLKMVRAPTVGDHPRFIDVIHELILERMDPTIERRAIGLLEPSKDVCPADCCPGPARSRSGGA